MQREEKQLEAALDAVLQRINEVKSAIATLIMKIEFEHATIQWPSVLDSFAVISGQMNSLLKVLKNEKTPLLRNLVVLPLELSPDADTDLMNLTENRVPAFSHDIAPNMLRTKPDPDVELRQGQFEQRALQVPPDSAQKQLNSYNKIVSNVLDLVTNAKEEWESEATARANAIQTCSPNDTQSLIVAVGVGKALKQVPVAPPQGQPTVGPGRPMLQGAGSGAPGKAPSAIKTNIKAATQMHPYR